MFVVGFFASNRRQDNSTMFRWNPVRYAILIVGVSSVVVAAFAGALFPSGACHVLAVALCLAQAAVLFMYAAFDAKLPELDPE